MGKGNDGPDLCEICCCMAMAFGCFKMCCSGGSGNQGQPYPPNYGGYPQQNYGGAGGGYPPPPQPYGRGQPIPQGYPVPQGYGAPAPGQMPPGFYPPPQQGMGGPSAPPGYPTKGVTVQPPPGYPTK